MPNKLYQLASHIALQSRCEACGKPAAEDSKFGWMYDPESPNAISLISSGGHLLRDNYCPLCAAAIMALIGQREE